MRRAFISDIHGNLEALQAVLADIDTQDVDEIHCLGDVIGYGCDPSACLKMVTERCVTVLMGNHEYAVLGLDSIEDYHNAARKATEWTMGALTDKEKKTISDFDFTRSLGDIFLVHASPFDPVHWHYILSASEAEAAFEHFKERICFFGHSHIPEIYTEQEDDRPRCQAGHSFMPDPESRYLINVGSVGQPRDNDPRSCYLIFDDEEYGIEYRRVDYDIDLTQSKMTEAKMPQMLIDRLGFGR